MVEDFIACSRNFQNLAADFVERLQSQTPPCTESGPFNYMMFDQSGGKARIFLSPSPRLVHEFPTGSSSSPSPSPPLPGSPDLYEDHGSLLELTKSSLRSSPPNAECDPRTSSSRETVAALQPSNLNLNTSDEQHQQHHRNQILAASSSLPFEEVYSAVLRASVEESAGGGYLYEDADDLEALLGCSDEEGSITGNAPSSELTCHFGLGQENAEPSSRKRGCQEVDEEVDSRFIKRQRSQEEVDDEVDDICNGTCSSSVSVIDGFSGDSLGPPSCLPQEEEEYSEGEEFQELDESALELQMLCDDFGFEMPEELQCSSCSKEDGGEGEEGDTISSGSARKSRRDKIKKTVKLLRNIIPGGNCMDTAIVLDEAIHYVKLLQLQVQTLEAKRLVERVR